MPIVVGIDGTDETVFDSFDSEARRTAYNLTFENSFVSQLCKNKGPNRKYLMGPTLPGEGLEEAVKAGYDFILERHAEKPYEPILLTGYSRGAVGVVEIATRLNNTRIPVWGDPRPPRSVQVKAMLLFDPVGRHSTVNPRGIPDNVEYVLDVRRDPAVDSRTLSMPSYDWAFKPRSYQPLIWRCTHACLGGVPWDVPTGRTPAELTLGGRMPPREYEDHGAHVHESWSIPATGITHREDRAKMEELWNRSDVRQFIDRHGFLR
jgi:hypothetical protein